MQTNANHASDTPFRHTEHTIQVVPGYIARRITSDGSVTVQVPIDITLLPEDEYYYLDMLNNADEKLAHLSIRPQQGTIVLNHMLAGSWGSENICKFPLKALNRWSFDLKLNETGQLVLLYEGTIILTHQCLGDTFEVSQIASNFYAALIVPSANHSRPLVGQYGITRDQLLTTVLFPSQGQPLHTRSLRYFLAGRPIAPIHSEAAEISDKEGIIAQFDITALPATTEGESIVVMDGTHLQRISDPSQYRSLQIGWGDITLKYLSLRDQPDDAALLIPDKQELTARRNKTEIQMGNWAGFLHRHLFLYPQALAQVWNRQEGSALLTFQSEVFTIKMPSQSESTKIFLDLLERPRSTRTLPMAIALNSWWTALCHSGDGERIFEEINSAQQLAQEQNIWPKTSTKRPPTAPNQSNRSAESEAKLAYLQLLKKATKIAVERNQDSGSKRQALTKLFRSQRDLDIKWTTLELSSKLIEGGLQDIVAEVLTCDFLMDVTKQPHSVWTRTTAAAAMALNGLHAELLANLNALDDSELRDANFDSISAAVQIARQAKHNSRTWIDLIYFTMRCLRHFNKSLDLQCKHVGLLSALRGATNDAVGMPNWFQDSINQFLLEGIYNFEAYPQENCSALQSIVKSDSSEQTDHASLQDEGYVSKVERIIGRQEFANFEPLEQDAQFLSSKAQLFQSIGKSGPRYSDNAVQNWIRHLALPSTLPKLHPKSPVLIREIREYIKRNSTYAQLESSRALSKLGEQILDHQLPFNRAALEILAQLLRGPDLVARELAADVALWCLSRGEAQSEILLQTLKVISEALEKASSLDEISPSIQSACRRLGASIQSQNLSSPGMTTLLDSVLQRMQDFGLWRIESNYSVGSFFGDTLIALYTCQRNLSSRAVQCANLWGKLAESFGIQVLCFVGGPRPEEGVESLFPVPIVYLECGDGYEDLPDKTLAMFEWIYANRAESYVLKIDDDCLLDPRDFFSSLSYRHSHYFGRKLDATPVSFLRDWKLRPDTNRGTSIRFDLSSTGTVYADGGGGYTLSRFAIRSLLESTRSEVGLHLISASRFEDKLLGDLLSAVNIRLSSAGYLSLQARRVTDSSTPVLQVDKTFFPSALSGVPIAHLDAAIDATAKAIEISPVALQPLRIWPRSERVSFGYGSNQLVAVSDPLKLRGLSSSDLCCVCVVRNEGKLLPHFLSHYRELGVNQFFFVDNLSSDGSIEYLCNQSDVFVFSASGEYRASRFGVEWQQAVLDHFCKDRWVVIADADEFLFLDQFSARSLRRYVSSLEASSCDAAFALMVDMYPRGSLSEVDFGVSSPLDSARCFDRTPVLSWPLNTGPFGNLGSAVSSLRHRLLPLSPPQRFTAQKCAVLRYGPGMAFSAGFHFAAGIRPAEAPVCFLHYKYSSDFAKKAEVEVQRAQHFGGAEEYVAYLDLVSRGVSSFWDDRVSREISPLECDVLKSVLDGVSWRVRLDGLRDVALNSYPG